MPSSVYSEARSGWIDLGDAAADDRPTDDERDEDPADAAPGRRERRRQTTDHEHRDQQPDRDVGLDEQPVAEHLVAGTEAERLSGQLAGEEEQPDQRDASDTSSRSGSARSENPLAMRISLANARAPTAHAAPTSSAPSRSISSNDGIANSPTLSSGVVSLSVTNVR